MYVLYVVPSQCEWADYASIILLYMLLYEIVSYVIVIIQTGSVDVLSSVSVKEGPVQCKLFGTIKKSPGKVLTIQADQHGRHFVVMVMKSYCAHMTISCCVVS